VAGKARVHELAKELGVESKTVLAKLQELGENGLTFDPELFRELVNAGLPCHCTPHLEAGSGDPRTDLTRALEALSFQGLHRVLMLLVLPCFCGWAG